MSPGVPVRGIYCSGVVHDSARRAAATAAPDDDVSAIVVSTLPEVEPIPR